MGCKSAILIFLWGLSMNGIVGLDVQVTHANQDPPIVMAKNEKPIDTEKKEDVNPSDQKRPASEPAKPKGTSRLKQAPPKDFVPSEKIPVDQAVDFPADI